MVSMAQSAVNWRNTHTEARAAAVDTSDAFMRIPLDSFGA